MTQFIELELSDGQIMRFNVAAISRYLAPKVSRPAEFF